MNSREIEQAVVDNQNLVRFAINRYFPGLREDEDIFQGGWIGLWKACLSYDSSKSKRSTFAVRCIINEVRMELRSRARLWRFGDVASLDELLYFDKDGGAVTLAHQVPDKSNGYCAVDYDISFLSGSLSEQELEVFKLSIYGFTAAEIGRTFGRTRAWASRIIRKAQAASRVAFGRNCVAANIHTGG